MPVRVLFAFALTTLPLVAAPVPKVAPKEGIIACAQRDKAGTRVLILKPDGNELARVEGFGNEAFIGPVRLSNDGKRVAVHVDAPGNSGGPYSAGEIRVYEIATPEKPVAVVAADLRTLTIGFGSDANTLYVGHAVWKPGEENKTVLNQVSRIDLPTGKAELLDKLDGHLTCDVSADGQSLLLSRIGVAGESYVADAVTQKMTRTTKEMVALHRFSPDGTKAVGIQYVGQPGKYQSSPVVVDLKTGTATPVKDEEGSLFQQFHWSADGTKLLAHRSNTKGQGGYVLCDPDGSNAKLFLDGKSGKWSGFDWR